METSILKSTKMVLGVSPSYTEFDQDILTHINSTFSTLTQLGVGPAVFTITDDTTEWSDYIADDDILLGWIRTLVHLKVRMGWDPPATSYTQTAFEKHIEQLEWRINVHRENLIVEPEEVTVDE
jgi:hypothetical protein